MKKRWQFLWLGLIVGACITLINLTQWGSVNQIIVIDAILVYVLSSATAASIRPQKKPRCHASHTDS